MLNYISNSHRSHAATNVAGLACIVGSLSVFSAEIPTGQYYGNSTPYIDFDEKYIITESNKCKKVPFKLHKQDEYGFLMTLHPTEDQCKRKLKKVGTEIKYEIIPAGTKVIGFRVHYDYMPGGVPTNGAFAPKLMFKQHISAPISNTPDLQGIKLGMSKREAISSFENNEWKFNGSLTSSHIKGEKEYSGVGSETMPAILRQANGKSLRLQFTAVGLVSNMEYVQGFSAIDCDDIQRALQDKYGQPVNTSVNSNEVRSSTWQYNNRQETHTEVVANCVPYLPQPNGYLKVVFNAKSTLISGQDPSVLRDEGSVMLEEILSKRNLSVQKQKIEL